MTATTPITDEQLLAVLQADFPAWRIWRTRIGDVPAWWAATRLDPAAGISATVILKTAEKLRDLSTALPYLKADDNTFGVGIVELGRITPETAEILTNYSPTPAPYPAPPIPRNRPSQ